MKIKDYTLIEQDNRADTTLGKFGGVAIYVKNSIAKYVKVVPLVKPDRHKGKVINVQAAAIQIGNTVIGVVYRPHGQLIEDYEKMAKFVLENFKHEDKEWRGDFLLIISLPKKF